MAPTYQIKAIRQIASGPGVLVREFTFAAGEATPWHRHSAMVDRCYGLAGEVTVEREDAPATTLAPGEVCETPTGVRHRLANATAAEARALLVQFGGRYDFLTD
jgi:quercetin dioxygenase-like cupin family protein